MLDRRQSDDGIFQPPQTALRAGLLVETPLRLQKPVFIERLDLWTRVTHEFINLSLPLRIAGYPKSA